MKTKYIRPKRSLKAKLKNIWETFLMFSITAILCLVCATLIILPVCWVVLKVWAVCKYIFG